MDVDVVKTFKYFETSIKLPVTLLVSKVVKLKLKFSELSEEI